VTALDAITVLAEIPPSHPFAEDTNDIARCLSSEAS
jgi:hypothetical protein